MEIFLSNNKESEKFEITRDHSYQKYKQVLEDINNKTKSEIIKKLSNYKYLKTFNIVFTIPNNDKITSSIKLISLFHVEYKKSKINYNDV